jgi:hypothetical protein
VKYNRFCESHALCGYYRNNHTLSERQALWNAWFFPFSQLSGEQFDQVHLSEGGINAHLENAATFQREAAFGQNPDLVRQN